MLWECKECGCQGINGDLDLCPQCYKPRPVAPAGTPAEEETPQLDDTASTPKVQTKSEKSKSDWGR